MDNVDGRSYAGAMLLDPLMELGVSFQRLCVPSVCPTGVSGDRRITESFEGQSVLGAYVDSVAFRKSKSGQRSPSKFLFASEETEPDNDFT